jgi:hypothetical protein
LRGKEGGAAMENLKIGIAGRWTRSAQLLVCACACAWWTLGCSSGSKGVAGGGNDAGDDTGTSLPPGNTTTCTFTLTGAETATGPCEVSVGTKILAHDPSTVFSLSNTAASTTGLLLFVSVLSSASDFHTGHYDTATVVSSSASTLVPGQLAGWGQSYMYQALSDQGSFTLNITSAGTVLRPVPGVSNDPSAIAGWLHPHGTLDITMRPLTSATTGEVMVHATF